MTLDEAFKAVNELLTPLLRLLEPVSTDPRFRRDFEALQGLPEQLQQLDRDMPLEDHPLDVCGQSDRWRAGLCLPAYYAARRLGDNLSWDTPPHQAIIDVHGRKAQDAIACLAANLLSIIGDYTKGLGRFRAGHAHLLRWVDQQLAKD